MNHNEHHLTTQVTLLDEFAKCLEKENQAKSREIDTLHQHLGLLNQENEALRNALTHMRSHLDNRSAIKSGVCSLATSLNLEEMPKDESHSDAWCQTNQEDGEGYQKQISQILELSDTIRQKDQEILKYQQEGEEMVEAMEELEGRINQMEQMRHNDLKKISQLQEKTTAETKRKEAIQAQLDQMVQSMASSGQDSQLFQSRCDQYEGEIQTLVSENNGLIERVRSLEREKNDYYHQIKRMSRASLGNQNLGESKKKDTGSKKRFAEIEESLRRLQNQNEAMHSNLIVQR